MYDVRILLLEQPQDDLHFKTLSDSVMDFETKLVRQCKDLVFPGVYGKGYLWTF